MCVVILHLYLCHHLHNVFSILTHGALQRLLIFYICINHGSHTNIQKFMSKVVSYFKDYSKLYV